MASNHTEACTAMRPGCDDEGACDCGYLDSVMREGYQQDYSTPPPAERCPRCGNGRGYNHCVCPRCVRCGSSNLHLGQMGSSKCFDCGNIAEAKAPQPEGCIDFPTERKSRAYHSPVFDRAEPAAPSYVCNCGQSFAHEYDRLLHAGDCPSVRKPAAAEVREWWIHLTQCEIWEMEENAPKGSINVIEKSAFNALMAKYEEACDARKFWKDKVSDLKAEVERLANEKSQS